MLLRVVVFVCSGCGVSCYKPLRAFRTPGGVVFSELGRHDIIGPIEIPCGQCIGCRLRRATDWSLRVMHEAQCWPENCFVTLTYGRDCMPANCSLCHRDVQLFLKRLRKFFDGRVIRYFMCGEYGPKNLRPHYHVCLFNVDFREDWAPLGKSKSGQVYYDSLRLRNLWRLGRVSVQALTHETAGYTARYIVDKRLGADAEGAYETVDADGVVVRRAPEYAAMSTHPGIGAAWFLRHGRDLYPHDFAVADGRKFSVPRYYDRLVRRRGDAFMDDVEFRRVERAKKSVADNTDERRRVREVVQLARVVSLKRESIDE